MRTRALFLLLVAALALGCAPASAQDPASAAPRAPTVVYVVRHAEKADDGEDPPLSDAGRARAATLARMFEHAGLTAIHSSPYRRTRDTAAPVAAVTGLTVREYDPRAPEAFAARLIAEGGRHLVLGHSNTMPQLVRALGGVAEDMPDTQYERLYEVVVGPDGVRTVLLGYPR